MNYNNIPSTGITSQYFSNEPIETEINNLSNEMKTTRSTIETLIEERNILQKDLANNPSKQEEIGRSIQKISSQIEDNLVNNEIAMQKLYQLMTLQAERAIFS